MLTIAPPPLRSIAWISYFMPRKVPRMLVRMPWSNSSGSMLASGAGMGPSVALLKAASRRPKLSTARPTSRSTEAVSPMSVGTTRAWPPSRRMPSATCSSACWSRAASTMVAPARANVCAVTAPMPRLAPATRATLPANCGGGGVVGAVVIGVLPASLSWSGSGEPVQQRHRADVVGLHVGQDVAAEAPLAELAQREAGQVVVPAGVVDEDVIGVARGIAEGLQQSGVVEVGLHLVPAGQVVPQLERDRGVLGDEVVEQEQALAGLVDGPDPPDAVGGHDVEILGGGGRRLQQQLVGLAGLDRADHLG